MWPATTGDSRARIRASSVLSCSTTATPRSPRRYLTRRALARPLARRHGSLRTAPTRVSPGSAGVVTTSGVAGQSVVRDRLPRRGRGDELPRAGPDPGILVERPHPDADRIGVARIAAEQRGAAVAAEPLLAAVRGLPDPEPVFAGDDPERARGGMRTRRRRGTAAPLAAAAVAVARRDERLGDLEPDSPAVAAPGERQIGHLGCTFRPRRSRTLPRTLRRRRRPSSARAGSQAYSRSTRAGGSQDDHARPGRAATHPGSLPRGDRLTRVRGWSAPGSPRSAGSTAR